MENTVFVSQKVDVKIIFTWPYWDFHDIPGPGGRFFRAVYILDNYKQKMLKSRKLQTEFEQKGIWKDN